MQSWVRVEVTNLNPRVVTSDATTMKIEGKITNISDRKIEGVEVRFERYDTVTSESALTSAITQPHANDGIYWTEFAKVADSLVPGQSVDFQLDVPLAAKDSHSLMLSKPGVYPLMVNVNGTPDYGKRAKLGTANTVLPVLAPPGGQQPVRQGAPAVTLLWPIADTPNVVGSDGNKIITLDDALAASLAPGGRLFRLVDALDLGLPPTAPAAQSLCLAIDPDLLTTVEAMARGYQVSTGGGLVAGKGADAAKVWLDKLRTVAAGRCVMALPYSDADLVALSRAGLPGLVSAAVGRDPAVDPAPTFQRLLPGAILVPDVVWPINGLVDQPTAANLVASGIKTLLLDPTSTQSGAPTGPVRLAVGGTTTPLAVPIDPLISSAYHAFGSVPASNTPDMQATLAAMVFRGEPQTAGQTVLIAPPTRWDVSTADLSTLLGTTQRLVSAGLMQPKRLAELSATTGPELSVSVNYPVAASAAEIPPSVISDLRTAWNTQQDLISSMHPDPAQPHPIDPKQLMAPELVGLLRGSSGAWRGNQPGAEAAIDAANQQLESVRQQVLIAVPPGTVTLTSSSDSSLPLSLSNHLPVAVEVQVTLSETAGLRTGAVNVRQVPPTGSSPLLVPAQVNRTGKFSVDVRISTPGGTPLGAVDPVRLQLRSTQFGTITSYVTGAAGILLVVLMVVRIVRRIRAARVAPAPPVAAAGTVHKVGAQGDPTVG
jgi:hypothetical protein